MARRGNCSVLIVCCVAACDLTEPNGCDLCTTSAVVYGTVLDSAGAPIVGVQVDVRAFETACTGGSPKGGTDNGWPITNAQGRYSARPISIYGPFTTDCLIVTANPRNDVRWPVESDTAQIRLRFLDDDKSNDRDSVEFNLVVGR
jgi:hypothetical protein